jgi:purine-binding chemotaxis protein CheW
MQDDARAGKYLTFRLDREEYGIGVMNVREIMGLQDITAVPQTAPHIKGVINLRGKVVPVIDLRLKFGLAVENDSQRACIIVTQVKGPSAPVLTGMIVDDVSDVVNLTAAEIEDAPDFGQQGACRDVLGLAKICDRVKILLNIETLLAAEQSQRSDRKTP